MRTLKLPGVVLVVAACLLAACGSSSSSSGSPTTVTQPLSARLEKAGPNPSISAKMVCAAEARKEIAAVLEVTATRVTRPTWHDHLYSCTYVYPKGSFTLSVKELVSLQATTDYYNSLEQKFGRADNLNSLGQGAFVARNGDAVVRKDYKVLLVDVHAIGSMFEPLLRPSDVAQSVATVILGCWTGA